MNWETSNLSYDETTIINSGTPDRNDRVREENEQKRLLQLEKFRRHENNENKTVYRNVMSQFGKLLTANSKEEIVTTILSDDCEIFLFNFAETGPAQYAFRHEGFLKLFEDKRIIKRDVKETFVSLTKVTGFQICECEIVDEANGSNVLQFSFEVFSFQGNKVSKIRSSYGSMPMSYSPSSLLIPTKKERMLAKVKELNYAFADQPDLEKIASLLHASTEYKIYRWNDKKCFSFDKNNIVSEFRKSLEEDFVITSVVPYDTSSEAQYIVGSYVYNLEGKHELSGQKFIWVSTCIYTFDEACNIKKMSQQGELCPEGEMHIPFQVHSTEKLFNPSEPPSEEPKNELSIFETERLNFSFDVIGFGTHNSLFRGHIKGLNEFGILEKLIASQKQTLQQPKPVDIFYEIDDPCYDSIIVIESIKRTINNEDDPLQGKLLNFYAIVKVSFENGKVAKILIFSCEVPEPFPSPYDDVSFTDLNFRPKSEFML